MVDGYSPMKGSLSSSSVATVCSSKSPSFVAGGPLSTYDEDENESDEEYTYVSVDDSPLEFDTLDVHCNQKLDRIRQKMIMRKDDVRFDFVSNNSAAETAKEKEKYQNSSYTFILANV
jgi:hypothetical protein